MSQWDSYLAHFGIFGMKWGVRRYQNEDGTLTEEGKKRYQKRSEDIELAKNYARVEITKDKESKAFWDREVEALKKVKPNKESIKKAFNMSEDDYQMELEIEGSPQKVLDYHIKYNEHKAEIYTNRIKDWNKKIKELGKIKIDAISSDQAHMREIENVFSQAKSWFFRDIELHPLHESMSAVRMVRNAEKNANPSHQAIERGEKRNKKVSANYKEKHPNTALTDKEILLNYYGYVPK